MNRERSLGLTTMIVINERAEICKMLVMLLSTLFYSNKVRGEGNTYLIMMGGSGTLFVCFLV